MLSPSWCKFQKQKLDKKIVLKVKIYWKDMRKILMYWLINIGIYYYYSPTIPSQWLVLFHLYPLVADIVLLPILLALGLMFPFWSWSKREGFLSLTISPTSLSLLWKIPHLDFCKLYLKVMLWRIRSSLAEEKSMVRSSKNLYSMFWMKSSLPSPSFCKNKTPKYLKIHHWSVIMIKVSIRWEDFITNQIIVH